MQDLLLRHLVQAHKVGDFTLTSGRKSDFYIDVKSLMFNAHFITVLGISMFKLIDSKWHDNISAIGGMELGSLPISTAVSLRSCRQNEAPYNHFVVRKQPKGHGTATQIEGYELIKGTSVVLVDDVFTTGGSLVKTYNILKDNDVNVLGAAVVVHRLEADMSTIPFPVYALTTKTDIMRKKQ